MERDVQLYEVTAAELLEPRADWSAPAQTNVGAALRQVLGAKSASVTPYVVSRDSRKPPKSVNVARPGESGRKEIVSR